MNQRDLRDWATQDIIDAGDMQAFTDRHNQWTPITGTGSIQVVSSPRSGSSISARPGMTVPPEIRRVRVTTVPNQTTNPGIVLVKFFSPDGVYGDEFAVKTFSPRPMDAVLYAQRPADGVIDDPTYLAPTTGATFEPVLWVEQIKQDFWAKINGHATLATNRWKYSWEEYVRVGDTMVGLGGGREGTTSSGYALNSNEFSNGSTGVMGNSVDHDTNYPSGFSLLPVQGGPIVRMYAEIDGAGVACYTFQYENAEQGTC